MSQNTFFEVFFFFSSRRRHTRSLRDWSSDVCSSDLFGSGFSSGHFINRIEGAEAVDLTHHFADYEIDLFVCVEASEPKAEAAEIGRASCRERCRSRWSASHCKKKKEQGQ